jgi:hypothetical protein
MGEGVDRIHEKIKSFQRKYYLNIFIRGAILTLSIICFYFLTAALLEHTLWLNEWARFTLLFTFFGVFIFCTYKFLKQPLTWWIAKKGMGEEQSAKIIGNRLPVVKDSLLNLIQLSLSPASDLARASILQKSRELEPVSFEMVVDLNSNKRYLKYLLVPISIILLIFFFNQKIITQSTDRIIHFNQKYSPQAPFRFMVLNESLNAFQNEDFTLRIKLEGDALPEVVYLNGEQRLKMNASANGEFTYTFENIQAEQSLQLEAAGFFSDQYNITLANRPELTKFKIDLEYPRYLQRKNESVSNAGNLEIPEGTIVKWNLNTMYAEKAAIFFSAENQLLPFTIPDDQFFILSKKIKDPDQYEIILENNKSKNKEKIAYRIDVIKDEYPQIQVNNFKDSILYKRVILGGAIADDYGISQLSLHFRIRDENQKDILNKSVDIGIIRNQNQQNFFYNWFVDSLKLKPGEQLEYYLQVWDNDGVNGRKATKSANYTFLVPSEESLITEIDKSKSQTEQKIDQSVSKANKLQDQIEQAYQKLKGKQNLDWQDKKMLEDILEQKQNLDQMIDQMKEQNKLLQEKKEAFTEQDQRIKEKAEQIQKLMDQLLDEETKKLFEELQKLLKENADVSQLQKLLDKLNQNTNNLEKELDRMLELFKEVEYEAKLESTIEKLKQQAEQQKALMDKTQSLENKANQSEKKNQPNKAGDKNENDAGEKNDNKDQSSDNQELAKEQEKLNKDFEKTSERIEELKKIGEELDKGDEELPNKEDAEDVKEEQQQSKESLEQNKPSKAKQSQQKALKKMQEMQQKMEGMQGDMEMDMDMENLEALRQIIHGLIKLSFDQENLMKNFGDLQQNDPRFNSIAQQQLKLKDDAKVLEDSLLALSKKDPFMGSFVTKEVGELNSHLDKVTEANRERKRPQASNEMQLSMTSINNLALMLDDHFDMMMQMMANAKPSMKKSKKKGNKPSLSQMQQQLNQKIQELKNSGKGGRQLSEELANMAAEQERIRKALKEMQEKMKNEGQMPGGDLPSKMEQTEMDLVNKQLTDQMIKRQKDILTRLLETEKSMREQDMDDERKGETAKDYEKEIPKAFEEYLRLKEKEVELLKTVPPKLYPYYKKEVGEYFKRIGNQ